MCDEADYSLDWIVGFDVPKRVIEREFTFIPRLNVSASARDGALNTSEHTDEMPKQTVAGRVIWFGRSI